MAAKSTQVSKQDLLCGSLGSTTIELRLGRRRLKPTRDTAKFQKLCHAIPYVLLHASDKTKGELMARTEAMPNKQSDKIRYHNKTQQAPILELPGQYLAP